MTITNIRLSDTHTIFLHQPSGNIYLCDGSKIFKYYSKSDELILLSDYGFYTTCISVTNDEEYLYFTDHQTHTISMMTLRNGKVEVIAGIPNHPGFNGDGKSALETNLFAPTSLLVYEEEDGREIYFYDIQSHRVRKITKGGTIETILNVGEYPTFSNIPTQINSCYGRIQFSESRKYLYISNEKYHLYQIDMETKKAISIFNQYALNNWMLIGNHIYACCYCNLVKIDTDNFSATNLIDLNSKGEFRDIAIIDENAALILVKYHQDTKQECCKVRLSDGLMFSTIFSVSNIPFNPNNRQISYVEPRKFFFIGNSAFNIPKLSLDTKIDNLIYFEPLLQKIAPILHNQIQQRQFNTEEMQYLIDYCIYHNYNDFKEVNSEIMLKLQNYFKTKFDPILQPLSEYINRISGMTPPPAEQPRKRRNPLDNQIPDDLTKDNNHHLTELFNDETTSDFSIFLKDIEWKCHKTILARSKFFQTLIESSGTFSDTNEKAFYMDPNSTNATILEIIIKYVYGIPPNVEKLSASDILELVQSSKLHELDSLGKISIQKLEITIELFDTLAQFVNKYEANDFPTLHQKLVQFALQNTHEVIEKIYDGDLTRVPSFVLDVLLSTLPPWAQFHLKKQLKLE